MALPDHMDPSRSLKPLLVILALLAAAFVFALPRLRVMMQEARKLDAQTSANMAEAGRAAGLKLMASAGREEANRKPDDPDSQLRAAHAARQVGMMEQAERHAEIAARLAPKKTEAWLILADLRRRSRNLQGAMEAYKSALAADAHNGPAIGGLASLYITLGWRSDANSLLQAAVNRHVNDLPLKVAYALAAIQSDDYVSAEKLLLEVKAAAENDVRLWSPLINLYNLQKRFAEAVDLANQVLARTPEDINVLNERGIAFYRSQRTVDAADDFKKVIELDSANPSAIYYLALCHQRMGKTPSAIELLADLMKVNPGFEQTRQILGKLYVQTGRAEEGRRLLAEYQSAQRRALIRSRLGFRVATKPKDAGAHYDLARAYAEDGVNHLAVVELRRTLELAPAHKDAKRLLNSMTER